VPRPLLARALSAELLQFPTPHACREWRALSWNPSRDPRGIVASLNDGVGGRDLLGDLHVGVYEEARVRDILDAMAVLAPAEAAPSLLEMPALAAREQPLDLPTHARVARRGGAALLLRQRGLVEARRGIADASVGGNLHTE
jgi:hypothetical protein